MMTIWNMTTARLMAEETGGEPQPGAGGGGDDAPKPQEGAQAPAPAADDGKETPQEGAPKAEDAPKPQEPEEDWSFEAKDAPKPEEKKDEKPAEEKEFKLVLPEGYAPDERVLTSATAAAKQFGVDGEAMGLVMRAMDADAERAHKEALRADGRQLRKDWGTNFDSNMAETRSFVKNLEEAGILKPFMKEALASPEGYRLMHGLSKLMAEDQTMAGAAQATSQKNEAHEIMNNRNHPLHDKWVNGDPEVTLRVDKMLGLYD